MEQHTESTPAADDEISTGELHDDIGSLLDDVEDVDLPFAPPQLHQAPIRLRPIVQSVCGGPAALASGSARLRALASTAHQRARHTRTRIAGDSPSDSRAPDAATRASELADRVRSGAAREAKAAAYELRETWNDIARLGRRWRRRRYGVRVGQESLARYRELGDHRREALELNALGRIYRSRGQYQEAVVCYTQALTIFERLGNRRGECLSLSNLGLAHDAQGNRVKAVRCYESALDMARLMRDRHIEGQVLANLGTAYSRQGRWQEARELWRQALSLVTPGTSAHRDLSEHLG